MSLLIRVSQFARRHTMWRPDTRVIAAVSGGSDSVALLLLLHDLCARSELVVDAVAHLNHATRGTASDEDEAFCRDLARVLNVPFECARVDIPAAAQKQRASIEIAARNARRDFFDQLLQRRSADSVATAHTQDDQAETVLLRMLRGTGVRGLAGIAPVRAGRIRPLLTCTREELRAELIARQQPWRDDATNADIANVRNRVRLELLPYLERHFNPSIRRALARLSDLARSDDAALNREAAAAALHVLRLDSQPHVAEIDLKRLLALPDAVSRRVAREVLETFGGTSYASEDVDALAAVAAGDRAAAELAGLRVEHSGDSVVLIRRVAGESAPPPFQLNLSIPGAVQAPDAGWVLEALGPQPPDVDGGRYRPGNRDEVIVDAADLPGPLIVRSRRPGDRIRPLGLPGHKKLQDVFVDRKVSRIDRDRIPLVTDTKDRIVWIAGHVVGEEFRVTDHTKAVIILKLRRVPAGRAS